MVDVDESNQRERLGELRGEVRALASAISHQQGLLDRLITDLFNLRIELRELEAEQTSAIQQQARAMSEGRWTRSQTNLLISAVLGGASGGVATAFAKAFHLV